MLTLTQQNGTAMITPSYQSRMNSEANYANMATFHRSKLFYLYYQNINTSLAKQDDVIRTKI